MAGAETVLGFFTRGWNWMFLDEIPRNFQLVGGVAVASAFVVVALAMTGGSGEERVFRHAPALFVVGHLFTLIVAGAFQDQSIVFDSRQMLPVYVAGVIVFVAVVLRLSTGRAWLRAALVAVLAVHAAVGVRTTVPWSLQAGREGLELNARSWKGSRLLAYVRALPPSALIVSNASDAIYHHTGRLARDLPRRSNRISARENPRFAHELRGLATALGPGSHLVCFDTLPWRTYMPTREELAMQPALREVRRESDGSVFAVVR